MVASSGCRRIERGVGVAAIAGALVMGGGPAGAGELKNLVTDLYGGDGITLSPAGEFHEAHFTSSGLEELGDLSDDVSRATAFAPFNSSATSITFDIQEGVPVRSMDSLGPLLAERATTIGRGRLNFGVSYTRIDYSEFEGDNLNDLSVDAAHDDCCSAFGPEFTEPDGMLGPIGTDTEFELDTTVIDLDLKLEQDIFAAFGTFGITDNWDVGAVVPIIQIDGKVKSEYATFDVNGNPSEIHPRVTDPNDEDFFQDSNREDAFGLGDIRLRTKYYFETENRWGPWTPDTAVAGQVSLPTGDEDDLLGNGDAGFLGLLIASKDIWRFTPHINVGYEVFTGSTTNNLRYAFSNEIMFHERVTGVTEIIGRWEPNGDGTGDVVDFSVGAKFNPIGDIVLTSNFLIPINKDTGLRADFIWGLAAEIAF